MNLFYVRVLVRAYGYVTNIVLAESEDEAKQKVTAYHAERQCEVMHFDEVRKKNDVVAVSMGRVY